MFQCKEFVNADNIAAGLSPFNPESVALAAGRLMLDRINELLLDGVDFALETTLSTKSYVSFIKKAKTMGYDVTLLYFWLRSPEQAMERVAIRVSKGGHHIPDDVVERRYYRGIKNLFDLYMPICDAWIVTNNMENQPKIVAQQKKSLPEIIFNNDIWVTINEQRNDHQ
ncbi:hypothetical protein GCM10028827_40000 [Mucilaginibacter myungsuensis]